MTEVLDLVKVYSHPRSGTNFVRAWIAEVFYPGRDLSRLNPVRTGHWSQRRVIDAPPAWKLRGGHIGWRRSIGRCFYVARDPRDVMASLYMTPEFRRAEQADWTPERWLREPIDWDGTPGHRAKPAKLPLQHWLDHVGSWADRPDVIYVQYERVIENPAGAAYLIAEALGLEPEPYMARAQEVELGLCGPFAHDGEHVRRFERVFTAGQASYMLTIVGEGHWALWQGERQS